METETKTTAANKSAVAQLRPGELRGAYTAYFGALEKKGLDPESVNAENGDSSY
jgi:hypothetical protein